MLTANYEYSRSNKENLLLPIQVQLFEKPKTFGLISGVIDYEKCAYLNA